jgi:hypothetical protein
VPGDALAPDTVRNDDLGRSRTEPPGVTYGEAVQQRQSDVTTAVREPDAVLAGKL